MKSLRISYIVLALAILLYLHSQVPKASAQTVNCLDGCLTSLSECTGGDCTQAFLECVESCLELQ